MLQNCSISGGCVIGICMGQKKISSDLEADKNFFVDIFQEKLYLCDIKGYVAQIWPPTKRSIIFDNLHIFSNSPLLFEKKQNHAAFEMYYFRNVSKINIVLNDICLYFYRFNFGGAACFEYRSAGCCILNF